VSRKFTMLFAIVFVSAFSAAACSGVEQEVREQVDQEIQEGQEQVEQEIQEGRTQIAEEIEGQ
jgi:sensor domain CHASE-containing protein